MKSSRRSFLTGSVTASSLLPHIRSQQIAADRHVPYVILVTLDGLRWQEVFRGADPKLLTKTGNDAASARALRDEFWRESPEQRRQVLLPFLTETIARQGRLIGNRDLGHDVRITNGLKFSYPGYNEMLTGAPDPRINSNDKIPNPNINVLEWLHGRPAFASRVAAFCSWDVFPFILNRARAGLPVQAGWEPIPGEPDDPRHATINAFFASLHREWDNSAYDALTFESALAHLQSGFPRVLYVGVGETDEHAHHNRYDFYLRAARRADDQIRRLWEAAQANPSSRGRTSLILTTDHGRGEGDTWTSHGKDVEGAEFIWIGLLGPHIEPLLPGSTPPVATQSQIAATVAALVGEDFRAAHPAAAPQLAELLPLAR